MKYKSGFILLEKKSINNLLLYSSDDKNKTFDVGRKGEYLKTLSRHRSAHAYLLTYYTNASFKINSFFFFFFFCICYRTLPL